MGRVRAGWAKRGEIYSALNKFKKTGKKIIVYAYMGISNADSSMASLHKIDEGILYALPQILDSGS